METQDSAKKLSGRFPGYVLVKMVMTDESWHVVRNIRGVTSFVGPGSKPVPCLTVKWPLWAVTSAVQVDYAVGDSVRVVDGPLGLYRHGRRTVEKPCKVTVSMFG